MLQTLQQHLHTNALIQPLSMLLCVSLFLVPLMLILLLLQRLLLLILTYLYMFVMYLCLQTYNVTFVKRLHPYRFLKMSPPYPHFMFSLITLLIHVILNFQLTKMILAFNVFSIFNLITLNYMKCYINLSWRLTNYIN